MARRLSDPMGVLFWSPDPIAFGSNSHELNSKKSKIRHIGMI